MGFFALAFIWPVSPLTRAPGPAAAIVGSTEEVIDLKTIDLNKQKVKTLKKILNEQFDDGCKVRA